MKRQHTFLLSVTAVTIIIILLIFGDALPFLRGPAPETAVWSWPYNLRPLGRWGYALAAGVFMAVVMAVWLWRGAMGRWGTITAVFALAIGSFLLQFGLVYADNSAPFTELVNRTLAVQTNGYLWTAANIDDLNNTLRHYPDAMAMFESDHARTHPPGLVVANWLTIRAFDYFPNAAQSIASRVYPARCTDLWLFDKPPSVAAALGVWAILPMLLAATAVFPAYALAKKLSPITNPILATGFVAAVPALLVFAPLSDQIFAFLTLCILLALHVGLQKSQPIWLFVAGALLSVATFFSVGNAALAVPIFIYGLLWQGEGSYRPSLRTQLAWTAVFGAGVLSIWLIYWAGWHIPPWQIVQAGLAEHYTSVTNERGYATWLPFNLLDSILFSGIPVFISFGVAVVFATQSICKKIGLRPSATPSTSSGSANANGLTVATAVLLILLLISGSTRGEVGRIWLFFMPLIAVSGGLWAAAFLRRWQIQWSLFVLQLGMVLAVGLAWKPVNAVIVANPIAPAQTAVSELDFAPLNAQFGDSIRLTQYAIAPATAGDALNISLQWAVTAQSVRPYTVFVHLLDAEGNLLAQQDGWPVAGQWPPTCWQPDSVVLDERQIALSAGASALKIGLYDAQTGVRLLTVDGQDGATVSVPTPQE